MLGFGDDMYTTASAFFGPEHPGKETLKKLSIEERIPKTFGNLDKYLAKKGTTFSAGNELSVADFKLYTIITLFKSGMLHGLSADIVEKYPHVSNSIKRSTHTKRSPAGRRMRPSRLLILVEN
ncbi:hypothetical protein KEM48_008186 [Puccinia striiformis f. sp. tritici PST-130]|nr:hypothetical protein KEM48_008186 [Puccinia striiformis f. sp. tritici PST-130]